MAIKDTFKSKEHIKKKSDEKIDILKGSTWFGVENILILRLIVALILLIVGLFLRSSETLVMAFMLLSFVCSGYDVAYQSVVDLFREKKLGYELLAVLACIVAFAISAWYEGAAVMLLFQGAVVMQKYAVSLTSATLQESIFPVEESYTVLRDENILTVPVNKIHAGDILDFVSGGIIPADCVVLEGEGVADLTAITGLEEYERYTVGSVLFAGSKVDSGVRVQLNGTSDESLRGRTLDAVSGTGRYNSVSEQKIRQYEKIYAPFALGLCLLIALLLIIFSSCGTEDAIHRALIILIVSAPAGLLLSIPVTYQAGLFRSLRTGVLVKSAEVLDAISRVGAFVFFKKDLLDTGEYHVLSMKSDKMDLSVLLKVAAHVSCLSKKAEAQAIVNAYNGIVDQSLVSGFEEEDDGYSAVIDGIRISLGNYDYYAEKGFEPETTGEDVYPYYMFVNGVYAGCVLLGETISDSARNSVLCMEATGGTCILLSDDNEDLTANAADAVGISEYRMVETHSMLISDVQDIKDRYPANSVIALIGKSNDETLIGAADLCVCMDGLHSSDALQTGAAVTMDTRPDTLFDTVEAGKAVRQKITQNTAVIAAVKAVLLLLALLGVTYQLWFAMLVEAVLGIAAVLRSISVYTNSKL